MQEAIDKLYRIFSKYPRPTRIDICPCGCCSPEDVEPLLAAPLRELNFKQMANYSFSAMSTQGSVADFQYFLPRLFEGVAEEDYSFNPEILFSKLAYAKWLTWPAEDQAALLDFLHSLWRTGLMNWPLQIALPAFCEIETIIASIACTDAPLDAFIDEWTKTSTMEADAHLIQFVTMYGSDFADGGTLRFAWWEKLEPQALTLRRWLLQPDTLQRAETSAHLLQQDGFEQHFQPALAILKEESVKSQSPI